MITPKTGTASALRLRTRGFPQDTLDVLADLVLVLRPVVLPPDRPRGVDEIGGREPENGVAFRELVLPPGHDDGIIDLLPPGEIGVLRGSGLVDGDAEHGEASILEP